MKQRRVSAALALLVLAVLATISGCQSVAFSKAKDEYKAAIKAWEAGEPANAVLLMAKAVEIDPELPAAKEFFRDNFESAVAQVEGRLNSSGGKAEHLFREQRYDAYMDLQKMYQVLGELPLPFSGGKKKKAWEWTTEIRGFSAEIESARVEAWNAYYAYTVMQLNNGDVVAANKALDHGLNKFLKGGSERDDAIALLIEDYLAFASGQHGFSDIPTLEAAVLAYQTVLHFDSGNKTAEDGIAELSVKISGLYVVRGQKREAEAGSKKGDDLVTILEAAAADYEKALEWNPENPNAEGYLTGIKVKIAEHYYQEGVRIEQSQGLAAKDRIIAAYEAAQKWVADYKDTDKRIFNVLVSVELQKLSENIGITRTELGKLRDRFGAISGQLDTAIGFLQTYIDLTENINKANKVMKTTAVVLKPMGAIPVVGSFLSGTGTYVEQTREYIIEKPAKKMKEIQKSTVDPLKAKLESFKGFLDNVIARFDKVDETLGYTDTFVLQIKDCVERKGDPSIFNVVEGNTKKVNAEYEKLNNALTDTNNSIDGVSSAIANMFTLKDYMKPVQDGMKVFMPVVDKISGVTDSIDKALNKKITVNYLIDKYTFTVMDILKGINGLISIVTDMLMDAALAVINPLLKELGIEFPEIPGIAELEREIDKYMEYYEEIQAVVTTVQEKVDVFNQIQEEIQATLLETMKSAACE